MIRLATISDAAALTLLGEQFIHESGYAGIGVTGNPFKLHGTIERLIESDDGVVYVAERDGAVVGGIGLSKYQLHFSDDWMAMELFWWVAPNCRNGFDGIRLKNKAHEWAQESGCTHLTMIDIPGINSGAAEIYQRTGGKLMERTWIWRL